MRHGSFTHQVFNQTPPRPDGNLFASDAALRDAVHREGVQPFAATLEQHGRELGRQELQEHAYLANRHGPTLRTHDARGERIDAVEFHPSWHTLLRGIAARGYHTGAWHGALSHAARAAGYLMQAQVETGSLCPTTMTYGAIAALRRDPWLARDWLPTLLSSEHDARDVVFAAKRGGLIGMGMTEKQGGSDVRANTTRAVRSGDGSYRITGHKWFFSAPQSDAHLVLAQCDGQLSCFFMPRRMPDGSLNGLYVQRLKDKLGNRSNASAEVEFVDAWAHLLGEQGRGVPTILEMGTYTRLDCVTGSAGMTRQALVLALHHARHRHVFGAALIEQPLMQSVLADLALESEAATALCIRLGRAFDSDTPQELALRRVLTSAAKFWVCKRACEVANEAMEVLGGNGYTEDFPLARIAREMPVNSIWEGSGNVMCLDVMRAFGKSADTRNAVVAELNPSRGRNDYFDAAFERFVAALGHGPEEKHARHFTQQFVTLVQAGILLSAATGNGATAVADAFCATRLNAASGWGAVLGSSDVALDVDTLLERASGE